MTAIGADNIPTKVCTVCVDSLFTLVGVDAHIEAGDHSRYTRSRTT